MEPTRVLILIVRNHASPVLDRLRKVGRTFPRLTVQPTVRGTLEKLSTGKHVHRDDYPGAHRLGVAFFDTVLCVISALGFDDDDPLGFARVLESSAGSGPSLAASAQEVRAGVPIVVCCDPTPHAPDLQALLLYAQRGRYVVFSLILPRPAPLEEFGSRFGQDRIGAELVISGPYVTVRGPADVTVDLADVHATAWALVTGYPPQGTDGVSLLGQSFPRRYAFADELVDGQLNRSVRDHRWKLVVSNWRHSTLEDSVAWDSAEFYDLETDPGETSPFDLERENVPAFDLEAHDRLAAALERSFVEPEGTPIP